MFGYIYLETAFIVQNDGLKLHRLSILVPHPKHLHPRGSFIVTYEKNVRKYAERTKSRKYMITNLPAL